MNCDLFQYSSNLSIREFLQYLLRYLNPLKTFPAVIFLCFAQFGGSFRCFNFDKLRETASLNLNFYFTQTIHSNFAVIDLCFYFDLVTVGTGLTLQVL